MIISIHIPKTGGSSFRETLTNRFGDALLLDYDDKPLSHSRLARRVHSKISAVKKRFSWDLQYQCVHGHFIAAKYSLTPGNCFITWLRDPAERLASHYYYWKRKRVENPQDIRKRMIEENWSLEQFCFAPEMRNLNSEFLWGVPLRSFAFIGISEYYDSELQWLSKNVFKQDLKLYRSNVNFQKWTYSSYFDDEGLKAAINEYHKQDSALYQWALEQRKQRL